MSSYPCSECYNKARDTCPFRDCEKWLGWFREGWREIQELFGGNRLNWKREAENDLRNYTRRLESMDSMRQKIGALEEQYQAIRCSLSDSTPVQGGGSRVEERMIDNIAERERLKYTYLATSRLVKLVEDGLKSLSDTERLVLDRFYINRAQGHVERLCEELNLEQAQIYRIKDSALYKFTVSMYGIVDY